jgi:hypothetical protein
MSPRPSWAAAGRTARDGGTLPLQIPLSPVPTATGHLTLAVVRDASRAVEREDLAALARSADRHEEHTEQLLDQVTRSLHHVGRPSISPAT